MKKLIVSLFALVLLSIPAYALEATVPQFDVYIGIEKLEFKNTEYPLLLYKDVTYFPMTYEYVRMLGLTNSWTDGAFHLSYWGSSWGLPQVVEWKPDVAAIEGELVSYPIYVNGKLIDNSKEEYPVFNARGITYFPLTWRFATEEFGLRIDWTGDLHINSDSRLWLDLFASDDGRKAYFDADIYSSTLNEIGGLHYELLKRQNYVFDSANNTVSEYAEKLTYDEASVSIGSEHLSVTDEGTILYDGAAIAYAADYAAQEKQRDNPLGIYVWGLEYELGGGKIMLYVQLNYKQPFAMPHASRTAREYWFIREGSSFTPLSLEKGDFYECSEYIDGTIYLCLRSYNELISSNLMYSLYTVGDSNELIPVTDPDHANIQLLGRIGSRPVIKATWQSEYEAVSAVNDGYFLLEADGSLTKIYPYVRSDDAVVLNNRLYLLLSYNGAILDTSTGELIPIMAE